MLFEELNGLLSHMDRLVEIVDPSDLINFLLQKFENNYELTKTPPSEINEILETMDFSDIDLKLKKDLYRYPLAYGKLGNKYNNILSHARYVLPEGKLQLAFDIIVSHISPSWTEACYMAFVKDFGTFLLEKVINENYPLYLLYFVEIHMLSGYDTYLHRKFNIEKDVAPFTQERKLDPRYATIFRKHIKNTIDQIHFVQLPNCNFDDFVKYRDNWNLMGSATLGIPMKIKTEGFRKATRVASKTTNLIYYDDQTLLEQLKMYRGHVIRPFLKTDEAAKSRVVIGYDTRSYIRCSYLEQFIANFNGKSKWTTVGDAPESLYQVRDVVNKNIKSHELRMICTDQSAFDQHQYKDLFVYAFHELCAHIYELNPQVEEIIRLEEYGMAHAEIIYPDGSKHEWKNGLLSGHKFTALIGSILNRSATYAALEMANIEPNFSVFQGDDALIMMNKDADYNKFLEQYTKLGLIVNPMKTWHGLNRTEYLHQVYIEDKVIALAMRAILGLYFKDPKSLEVAPDQYFSANIDQFRMASRRGLSVNKLLPRFVKAHIKKYSNISWDPLDLNRQVYNLIHTPTLYGGLGFESYVESKYYRKIVYYKTQARQYTSEIISPYQYRINGDPILTKNWILKKVFAHLPAPHINTSLRIHKVDLTERERLAPVSRTKDFFSYDNRLNDNSQNWINHCKSLVNEACEYGLEYINRFNKARSNLEENFNLISNITNAFIGFKDKQFWKSVYQKAVAVYTKTKVSIRTVQAYMQSWRSKIYNHYRNDPPPWYNYGFYF
jgi:hypothetical protein